MSPDHNSCRKKKKKGFRHRDSYLGKHKGKELLPLQDHELSYRTRRGTSETTIEVTGPNSRPCGFHFHLSLSSWLFPSGSTFWTLSVIVRTPELNLLLSFILQETKSGPKLSFSVICKIVLRICITTPSFTVMSCFHPTIKILFTFNRWFFEFRIEVGRRTGAQHKTPCKGFSYRRLDCVGERRTPETPTWQRLSDHDRL